MVHFHNDIVSIKIIKFPCISFTGYLSESVYFRIKTKFSNLSGRSKNYSYDLLAFTTYIRSTRRLWSKLQQTSLSKLHIKFCKILYLFRLSQTFGEKMKIIFHQQSKIKWRVSYDTFEATGMNWLLLTDFQSLMNQGGQITPSKCDIASFMPMLAHAIQIFWLSLVTFNRWCFTSKLTNVLLFFRKTSRHGVLGRERLCLGSKSCYSKTC